MDKLDDMIGRALDDEDRALLARHGEPGYVTQALGLFHGPMAWALWVAYAAGVVAFLAGAWAVWQMVAAADPLSAVKWGVGAVLLFQVTTMTKAFMGNHLQANRMLRELKRLELQVSLLRADRTAAVGGTVDGARAAG
jgi:hypothetical protein